MQKRPANPKMLCRCGGPKDPASSECWACRQRERGPGKRLAQVLTGAALGKTFKELALEIGISVKTVEFHWARVKAVYGLASQVDAAHWALANRLVTNKYKAAKGR